jgi:hypothetical protein
MDNEPEQNLFDFFDTASGIMAYVHRKYGAEALREAISLIPEADKERLQAQAEHLASLSLYQVAEAVMEAAEEAGSELDRILSIPDKAIRRARLAAAYRHGEISLDAMIAAGVDPQDVEFATGASANRSI